MKQVLYLGFLIQLVLALLTPMAFAQNMTKTNKTDLEALKKFADSLSRCQAISIAERAVDQTG